MKTLNTVAANTISRFDYKLVNSKGDKFEFDIFTEYLSSLESNFLDVSEMSPLLKALFFSYLSVVDTASKYTAYIDYIDCLLYKGLFEIHGMIENKIRVKCSQTKEFYNIPLQDICKFEVLRNESPVQIEVDLLLETHALQIFQIDNFLRILCLQYLDMKEDIYLVLKNKSIALCTFDKLTADKKMSVKNFRSACKTRTMQEITTKNIATNSIKGVYRAADVKKSHVFEIENLTMFYSEQKTIHLKLKEA